jgi:hypothetical protein
MSQTLHSSNIIKLQSLCIPTWEHSGIEYKERDFYQLVEENHAFNYQLWHAEDRARRDDKGYEFVYLAKREIDSFNQQRNNRMEAMDEWLFHELHPAPSNQCPVHSESPGMMIDRLSILALKSYHMALQTKRMEASQEHRQLCTQKLATIHAQLQQLASCFDAFIQEVRQRTRTFRVYHQFKMYNDPSLNPELYSSRAGH